MDGKLLAKSNTLKNLSGNIGKAAGTMARVFVGGPDNGDAMFAANNTGADAINNNYQEYVYKFLF